MQYWEELEHSRDIGGRALALMAQRGIAQTPVNYELWFLYGLGQNRELILALDALVRDGQAGDLARVAAIHARFCYRADDRTDQANSRIRSELGQLATALATVGEGAVEYGKALDQAGAQLSNVAAPHDVRNIIDRAANATSQMEVRNRVLEAQVKVSGRELETLRSQLEEMRKESRADSLTGLANRRAFDDGISRAITAAEGSREPLCLLMCDIDRFKVFNDTWGHATGDQVLRLVASVLKANVGEQHLAARYGGEELAVVLPATMLAEAVSRADQIRTAIETKKVIKRSTGESLGQITISIGVAQYDPGETLEEFLGRADSHLYTAKETGRNRVCWVGKSAKTSALATREGEPQPSADPGAGQAERPNIELEFADQDTPLVVDAGLATEDPRLSRALDWWKAECGNADMPAWKDDYLLRIDFAREIAHLHQVDDASDELVVRFVGRSLIDALGEDPTGYRYGFDQSPSAVLKSSADRVFQLVSLTRQKRAPLRAYSKFVRHLRGQRLSSEVLFLPFSQDGKDAMYLLGISVYTPSAVASSGAAA